MTPWDDTMRLFQAAAVENEELRKRIVELEKCVKLPTPINKPVRAFERDRILHAVCAHYSMSEAEVLGPSISKFDTEPRHVLFYLLRIDHGMALERIGEYVHRHHATVINGVRQARLKHKRKIAAVRELLAREAQ